MSPEDAEEMKKAIQDTLKDMTLQLVEQVTAATAKLQQPSTSRGASAKKGSSSKEAGGDKRGLGEIGDSEVDLTLLDNTGEPEGDDNNEADPPPAKKAPPAPPFVLGEGLPVIPAKLTAKIQRGEFVDMADLLKDNLEAERRRLSVAGGVVASLLAGKPPRREVPDLLSWITSFGMYASILSEKHPALTQGLWAYQTFLVREARRCGGNGWQEYDLMFRQQATATELKWASINSSLYTVTFGAPASRGQSLPIDKTQARALGVCKWCQEPDHTSVDCALAPQERNQDRRGSHGEVGGRQQRSVYSKPGVQRPCFSWNNGKCKFEPDCRFQHVCSVRGCQGPHKASECRLGRQQDRRPTGQ